MLNIPESVKTLFKQDGVHKNFRVQFPNGERDDLTNANVVQESVRFTESLCSQDIFKFGLAEASVLEFETVGVENIYGAMIKAGIEIDLSSLSAEEISAIEAGTWDGELVELPGGETQTGSGAIVTFEDCSANVPLKALTVGIEPVQEGSGDPSPENVRPISGWDSATIYATGKNFLDDAKKSINIALDQTVYGGTLDVTNGVLIVDRAMISFGPDNYHGISLYTSSLRSAFRCRIDPISNGKIVNNLCDRVLVNGSSSGTAADAEHITCRVGSGNAKNWWYIFTPLNVASTVDEIKAWFDENPLNYVYVLNEPVTYQLTPTQVLTLAGINNIWADSGDIINAEYQGVLRYFRVPYGEFTVESCPRDHQAMTHRKVTAYTVGRLNRSPLEESKLTWMTTKKVNYRPNAQRLVMAELGWNSPQILDTMTKTQYDAFDTWASDEKNLFWQPFDPDPSRVSADITVKRRYLPFGDGVVGNALYCLEMQKFDLSSVLDAIADYIDNGDHSAELTPYRGQILGFIQNSIKAVIGEFYFTSGIEIFYPHWAQPTSMYIPYSFTVSVGGIDPISAASWSTEETGAPFTTDPVLYTYDFDDGNIILAYEPTGSVRTSAGKRWTYLDAYDINDIVGGVLETEAAFARVERGGGFGFYHLDDSSPVPVIPGEYEQMWFDEYDVEPIGTVRYAYTNKAGEEQVGESTVGDGASVYDMTDNAVLKKMLYGSNDLLENLINTSFVPHIDPINFTPVDLTMKGLPYIQAGDCLEVTAQDGTICKTFVLRQEISGIQALSAQVDSQSGLIIESEGE